MPLRHLLLALSVVAVWGSNFVIIKWALATFTPLWLAALRFSLAALPLLWIVRPAVPARVLVSYGLLIGVGQFGLLFWAMRSAISPGVASLVLQSQVFFTLLLALLIKGQRLKRLQTAALVLAWAGIAWIAWQVDGSATPLGLSLALVAAFCWGCANLIGQSAGKVDMLGFMVWSSACAAPALIALAWWVEGPQALLRSAQAADVGAWTAVLWQALGNTLFGYGIWGWLLARHAAAQVVPTALLVPVIGMGCAAWWMGEALPAWKLQGAALVMAGLGLNLWSARR
ncbi:EamA family transporter [Inhella inkyongensis]|uniref:EamA family transporter n=1 Tax=Inhella inkyongensis TaxID=392593 RepID=UPI00110EF8B6|nr:EamA family transporter [Inhella inkyongensis]